MKHFALHSVSTETHICHRLQNSNMHERKCSLAIKPNVFTVEFVVDRCKIKKMLLISVQLNPNSIKITHGLPLKC